jgi:hypothetical protein
LGLRGGRLGVSDVEILDCGAGDDTKHALVDTRCGEDEETMIRTSFKEYPLARILEDVISTGHEVVVDGVAHGEYLAGQLLVKLGGDETWQIWIEDGALSVEDADAFDTGDIHDIADKSL